jgi:hypothetical protein
MKARDTSGIPCVLLQSLPPVAGMALRALSTPRAYLIKGHAAVTNEAYRIGPRITHVDYAVIRGYFRQHDIHVPRLPANKTIRLPGFQMQKLPGELECKLSVLPAGYERRLIGHDVLLIETVSDGIIDIMRDIYATL